MQLEDAQGKLLKLWGFITDNAAVLADLQCSAIRPVGNSDKREQHRPELRSSEIEDAQGKLLIFGGRLTMHQYWQTCTDASRRSCLTLASTTVATPSQFVRFNTFHTHSNDRSDPNPAKATFCHPYEPPRRTTTEVK